MGARSERRGTQYGNGRGKPDKQARARRNREESARHQTAREEVARNNAELERLESQAKNRATTAPAPSMTTIRERMDVKHREAMEQAAATASAASPSAVPPGARYAACHCSHAGHPSNTCSMCSCEKYRPVTAPDPVKKQTVKISDIKELLIEGHASAFNDTVKLTERIEDLLVRLKEAVLDEDRKAAEERAREAAREKVRGRMAELEAEMDRLRAELNEPHVNPTKRSTKRASSPSKPYDGPPLICPECHRDDFKGPQGLGSHRFRTHGVKGTSRD